MPDLKIFMVFFSLFSVIPATHAQSFESGEQKVSLLELYTSEGCSSCPPADRWLSGLKNDPRLWKQLIPLAFHVDYWDYIGWQDRFANPRFSQRQRLYAGQNRLSTVYTPGFLLNGQEWRTWFYQRKLSLDQPRVGNLQLQLDQEKMSVQFSPTQPTDQSMVLNIALLGFDLKSQVNAGENHGRELKHDFVVLAHKMVAMDKTSQRYRAEHPRFNQQDYPAQRYAIVAWVNPMNNLSPLQATGGWIKKAL